MKAADDGRSVGDEVIGNAGGIVADNYGLIEKFGEPFGGRNGVGWKCECGIGNGAGDAKSDAGEIGGVGGANPVHGGNACGVDKAAVEGIDGPGAVEL